MMTKSIKKQVSYVVIFILSALIVFICLAENMHTIQHSFKQQGMGLEYRPIRSSMKSAKQIYQLETYQANASSEADLSRSLAKSLAKHKKTNNDGITIRDDIKRQAVNESQIVDHQIFASPNSIRSTKRIFI